MYIRAMACFQDSLSTAHTLYVDPACSNPNALVRYPGDRLVTEGPLLPYFPFPLHGVVKLNGPDIAISGPALSMAT